MLNDFSVKQIKDLIDLLETLTDREYTGQMEVVFGSSIGKHTRHIIEFYRIFFEGYSSGYLNYEHRERRPEYETDRYTAVSELERITENISAHSEEKNLQITVSINGQNYEMQTTARRELLYLMEHTTHHIAQIRLGLQNICPEKNQLTDTGIAYSTPKVSAE